MTVKTYILEFFALIKGLTFDRLGNLLRLKISYFFSLCTKKYWHWGNPMAFSIEPANFCNLNCVECPTGNGSKKTSEKRLFSLDKFEHLLDIYHKHVWITQLFFQGEPFLNNYLYEMIKECQKYHLYSIVSTNGHFLSTSNADKVVKSGLTHLIISLDGIKQSDYEQYRKNGNVLTVIEGIQNIVKSKKINNSHYPIVEVQCLLFSFNEHKQKEIFAFAKKLGVDKVTFKKSQFYNLSSTNHLIPTNANNSRYTIENEKFTLKRKAKNHCWKNWHSAVINVNEDMLPCCFDKNADHAFGTFSDNCFNNKKAQEFRQNILSNRDLIDICQNCPF